MVQRYLRRRLGEDAGEELAAETFVQAFVHRDRFDPNRGEVRPWLLGIATNLLRHRVRAERAQLAAYGREAIALERELPDVATVIDTSILAPALSRALEELSPVDRDVLLLHAWADLRHAEIAQALDMHVGTVKSRLHRVRRKLQATLDPAVVIADERTEAMAIEEELS